ncbi:MAG: metallophosphoesterase [Tannerella sp.]|nr:metallophosphoesterase [Tannerella sp.]
MKKTRLVSCLLVGLIAVQAFAQEKKPLQFNRAGKFRIAQFTDLHWTHGSPNCETTAAVIRDVLKTEKPDLAIVTGDVVWEKPEREPWAVIARLFEEAETPFAVVLGNHDAESSTLISRSEIFDLLSRSPWFVGEKGPEDIHGCGNYVLTVRGAKANAKTAALLYFLDSNAYPSNPRFGTYAPVYFDQIRWYRTTSDRFTAGNDDTPYPALAFFHIPLPEYREPLLRKEYAGHGPTGGGRGGSGGSGAVNTGLFASILEKKDVMGLFVGHIHGNDYIGIEKEIALAYGRKTGEDGGGNLPRGARIIELFENERVFDSWIRTRQTKELVFHYPSGISSVDEETMTYLPAQKVSPRKQGVGYTFYEGDFQSVDQIAAAHEVGRGILPAFSVDNAPAEDRFAYDFKAWIRIPKRGVYHFYTAADDGSRFLIDGLAVIDTTARHASAKVALEAGFHDLRVLYFEKNGGEFLEVSFETPTLRRQPIPKKWLFVRE